MIYFNERNSVVALSIYWKSQVQNFVQIRLESTFLLYYV